MAKILSTIMAVIMLVISSIVPGFVAPGTDTVSTSDWLYELDVEFGFAKNDDFDEEKCGK